MNFLKIWNKIYYFKITNIWFCNSKNPKLILQRILICSQQLNRSKTQAGKYALLMVYKFLNIDNITISCVKNHTKHILLLKKPIVKLSKSIPFQKNNGSNKQFCIEFDRTHIHVLSILLFIFITLVDSIKLLIIIVFL